MTRKGIVMLPHLISPIAQFSQYFFPAVSPNRETPTSTNWEWYPVLCSQGILALLPLSSYTAGCCR